MSIENLLGEDVENLHQKDWKIKHGTPNNPHYKEHWNRDDYFKFCFIRNPFDRAVSSYYFDLKIATESTIDLALSLFKPKLNKRRRMMLKWFKDSPPQKGFSQFIKSNWFYKNSKHLLRKSVWSLQHNYIENSSYDFIGRFENLQEHFNTISDKIKITNTKLPHINKSKHDHYTEYYDDETRNIIAEKYAKDIKYFEYEFK